MYNNECVNGNGIMHNAKNMKHLRNNLNKSSYEIMYAG